MTSKRKPPHLLVPAEPKGLRCREGSSHPPWSGKLPAPGSLNACIRTRKRERLFVKPIAWTKAQLQLLDATFENSIGRKRAKLATQDSVQQYQIEDKTEQHEHSQVGVEKTSRTEARWEKQDWLQAVMTLKFPNPRLQRLTIEDLLGMSGVVYSGCNPSRLLFCFGDEPPVAMSIEGLYHKDSAPAHVAYINLNSLSVLRKRHIWDKNPTRGRANTPVMERRKKILRSITPPNPCEDPYIISILIALAQERQAREELAWPQSKEPHMCHETQTVHLIALLEHWPPRLYFYTASVSAGFLQKLQQPSECSKDAELKVRYVSVSLEDPLKAARRIWRVLERYSSG